MAGAATSRMDLKLLTSHAYRVSRSSRAVAGVPLMITSALSLLRGGVVSGAWSCSSIYLSQRSKKFIEEILISSYARKSQLM